MSHFDPTNYWNPSPRNLNRMMNAGDEEQRRPSPGPSRPQVASGPIEPGMGRPAIPSPLGIYGRTSPRLLPPEDEEDALSNASKDSFDWFGDDQQQMADEDYEEILIEQLSAKPQMPAGEKKGFKDMLLSALPSNFFHNVLLLVFFLCIIVYAAKLVMIPMPEIGRVPLDRWSLILFMSVFTPVWIDTGILKLARLLHSTGALSKTELPGRLEEMRRPIALCVSALIVGTVWINFFPIDCAPEAPAPNVGTVSGETTMNAGTLVADPTAAISNGFNPLNAPLCYYFYVPRLFFFLFVAGLVTALDGLLMSTIRSTFQEKNFKSRIVENRFKVFVVDQLLLAAKQERLARQMQRQSAATAPVKEAVDTGAARQQTSAVVKEFMFNLPFLVFEQARRYYRRWFGSTSSSTYRRVREPSEATSSPINMLSGEFDDFKRELLQTIQVSGYESVAKAPPRTELEVKVMARMIFHYLCAADRNQLVLDDFAAIISNETACRDAYSIFDYDKDGSITKSEFRSAVIRIFREQRNLAQSVANTGSALSILDTVSMLVIGIGLFLLLLALIGVRVQNILAVTASVVLGLNFVIFDGANKTFTSLIFLFLMHPYDVGDRVILGRDVTSEEDILTVMEINIQNTLFKKWNGLIISTPNHVLAGNPISNLSRTSEQWERVEFRLFAPDQMKLTVDEETEKLAALRARVDAFVRQYHQDYYQAFELRAVIAGDSAKSDKNLDELRFVLKIRCRETIDSQKKWIRHARLLAFVKQAVQHSGVEFAANAA